MKHHLARRLGVLTAGAVALTGLTLGSAGSAQAVLAGSDAVAATAASTWIRSQLKDGIVSFGGDQFANYGATIDAALGMRAAGVGAPTQAVILAAITADVTDATSGFGDVYAGSTAKVAYYAQQNGKDAETFGGVDLIAQLEPQIVDGGASTGRLFEGAQDDEDNDYGNVFSQSFAAAALRAGGSTEARAAQSFLLEQQCAAGFFTEGFAQSSKSASDQTCTGNASSQPSVDATALAALVLAASPDAAARSAAGRAIGYLTSVQAADGSFNPAGTALGGNASSTGYAGWALGMAGQSAAAARAAVWLRGQQLANAGACTPFAAADNGAVAQDAAARTAVAAKPIGTAGDAVVDQFRVATAQTIGALAYAPAPTTRPALTSPVGFLHAGGTQQLTVGGIAPGSFVCVSLNGTTVGGRATSAGVVVSSLPVPAGTSALPLVVSDVSGVISTTTLAVLDKTTLRVTGKSSVRKGKKQVVQVVGLYPGERVTGTVKGTTVGTDVADAFGFAELRFKAKAVTSGQAGKPGKGRATKKSTVVLTGQFADRVGAQKYRVGR